MVDAGTLLSICTIAPTHRQPLVERPSYFTIQFIAEAGFGACVVSAFCSVLPLPIFSFSDESHPWQLVAPVAETVTLAVPAAIVLFFWPAYEATYIQWPRMPDRPKEGQYG